MSDAPREEEIYQALAPGGSYKTGLVSPVAAQSDELVSTPMRFRGAMGGQAVGNDDYPDHEPRAQVPYQRYKDLEDTDPKLHEAVTHVADDLKIPRTDLASLVYANSDNNPNASNGARTGYMGLTPDDARNLDPEGHLNINDPIDNLYLGAMKYKRMANRFGMGSPNAFAAYHGGGDTVNNLLGRNADEHARSAPDGMFSFLNKVLGRGEGESYEGPPETPRPPESEAVRQQRIRRPESYEGPPEGPATPIRGIELPPPQDRDLEPSVGAALARTSLPRPVGNQVDMQRALTDPAYREAIMPTMTGPGASYAPPPTTLPVGQQPGQVFDVSGARAAIGALQGSPEEEAVARGVPVEQVARERAARTPAPPPPRDLEGQRAQAYTGPVPTPGQGLPVSPEGTPPPPAPQPPPPAITSGGYGVGGALKQTPPTVPGEPPPLPSEQLAATTGSSAPPAAAAPAPRQAIGTDNMASQLNQQELARVQGGRPDVAPTGPTQAAQAPAPPPSSAAAPPAATPTTAAVPSTVAPPAEPGQYTAIGDSLAAHMIRKGGARGQEDPNKIGSYREGDTAVSGWGTQKVLELIDKIPPGQIQGQNVVLSTGASNSPADLAAVPKQIAKLKKLGAKSVSVVGVGTREDFAGVNDKLAGFVAGAKDPSVVFAGPLPNVGADKVHSTNPTSVLQSAQQALAKAGGGDPVPTTTTGSDEPRANVGLRTAESTPGTGAAAGMPAANLPAGAPRALAPPGSAPTATSAPPIDRLKGSPTAMTAAGVVRAAASGGPDGVLTYMTRNAPRGMSVGDAWDHTRDLMAQSLILQGKYADLHHVDEYIFRMQHKGAMDNVMQAIGNMDDPNTAAQYLAKAHAFVTDGTQVGFQVLNGQIFGQRYDEQTHNKIGGPFQVTEQGLRRQALANYDPAHFSTNLNAERQTNETHRHNENTEDHANRQLTQADEISRRSLQEKQIEFDTRAADRRAEKERDDERARTLQRERLQEAGDQRERDRLARQDVADAASRERAARTAEIQHERQQAAADRAAEKDRTQLKVVNEDLADIGDQIEKTYPDPEKANQARQMYSGMRVYNPTIDHKTAQNYMHGLMTNKYSLQEAEPEEGKKEGEDWVYVRDKSGNELARVPRRVWAPYLPSSTSSTSTRPPPRAPR